MIYNNDFVWLHFPKCAGTKTEQIFQRHFSGRRDIHQDINDPAIDPKAAWHHSLAEREWRDKTFVTGNRLVICAIRRLPAWLESRYNFEVSRSPQLHHQPERLLTGHFLHANGSEGHADSVARRYLPDSLLASPRLVFVRTEHFEADFRRVFAPFVDVDCIPAEEFAQRENAAPNVLPAEFRERLRSPQALAALYAACPLWARVEALAYDAPAH